MSADRLRALMRRGHKGALALVLLLALVVLGVAGCGNDLSKEADEGIPIQLGDLEFTVQETRFLNPDQSDDKEYLAGQQLPTPPGKLYLGVFLTIHNSGGNAVRVPTNADMSVVDTTGAAYQSIPSHTDFAAPLGSLLAPGADIPAPGTAAANGPTQGALVLFLVNQDLNENRPPKLEIDSQGETGEITLDI
ncbi:MAG TPA: hypothetical protein VFY30_10265 [Solirubrobacterales bacterium]|nr:hypothetical protein [Solirubrobacterales bacterium]